MKLLTVSEYNNQVRTAYPEKWSQCYRNKGFVCTTDDFKFGAWGITEDSAFNKFKRLSAIKTFNLYQY